MNNLNANVKIAILTGKMKNAIIGRGLPSYTAAAQRWHGNAANLKNKPKEIK
jgi:hypothetical protein